MSAHLWLFVAYMSGALTLIGILTGISSDVQRDAFGTLFCLAVASILRAINDLREPRRDPADHWPDNEEDGQ